MLKAQFRLDDESLEVVQSALIKAGRISKDEDGEVLVWIGNGEVQFVAMEPLRWKRRTPRIRRVA